MIYLNNISKPQSYFYYLFQFSSVWKYSVGKCLKRTKFVTYYGDEEITV